MQNINEFFKLRIKRLAIPATALLIGAAVGVATKQHISAFAGNPPPEPLTAVSVERAINADGTERYRFERTFARRADGSVAVAEHRFYKSHDGKPVDLAFRYIRDVQTRTLTSVYPAVSARISSRLQDRIVEALTRPAPAACEAEGYVLTEEPPVREMLGYTVVERRRQLASTDGMHQGPEEIEWVAPALGCLVLRRELQTWNSQGDLVGRVVVETSGVQLGTPDPALFEVPREFLEMTPSQVMAAQNLVQGIECSDCDSKAAGNADRYYFAHQATSGAGR